MLHPRKKSPLFVVPGTYYCCSIIRTAVRTEKQARGYKNIIPGGKTVFHPRKNFHTYANSQMETRRKTPGRNSLRKLWKPLPPRKPSKPSPGGHLSASPARQVGLRHPFFRRAHSDCCVGRAWRSGAATGGRVALGRTGASRGILTF